MVQAGQRCDFNRYIIPRCADGARGSGVPGAKLTAAVLSYFWSTLVDAASSAVCASSWKSRRVTHRGSKQNKWFSMYRDLPPSKRDGSPSAARRTVRSTQNEIPRARACVPEGSPPDPLERSVKTALFLEFWRLWGQKPAQNQRAGSCARVPQRGSFFAVLSSFLLLPLKNQRFFIIFIANGTYFTAFCECKCP